MAVADVTDWMDDFSSTDHVWYAKRLSGNDTLANKSHQAGPYVQKEFFFRLFPKLYDPKTLNPSVNFDLYIDSSGDHQNVRAVWYNGKLHGKTRNESRLTNFGGSHSAFLDPDSTGALVILAFKVDSNSEAVESHAWVCRNPTEEDLFEERLGPIEPKQTVVWRPGEGTAPDLFATTRTRSKFHSRRNCSLDDSEIPPDWLIKFPSGKTIILKTVELQPLAEVNPDIRLLRRRKCEYEIFQSIEKAFFLPRIEAAHFDTVENFVGLAQSILQSRKTRSGNSLELHAREILIEEGFVPDSDFSHRPKVEGGKQPDFIFPSRAAYFDEDFPQSRLRMLAAKTTCKDRWRQVINEANRIQEKHLLTLQEGISENQFAEMQAERVKLVVPIGLHRAYSKNVRPHLISFESFIGDIRLLALAT